MLWLILVVLITKIKILYAGVEILKIKVFIVTDQKH